MEHPLKRVLVVDDNQDVANSLGILLAMTGHEVRTVPDGRAALEAAQSYRPEVVLVDLELPHMSGCEVARRLQMQPGWGTVVFIALAGLALDEADPCLQAAGFQQHLVKPIEPEVLLRLLACC